MSPKTDSWVRLFDVSDPVRHKKGYTIYKVTSKVFPRWSPEAVSEIVVWKRFSDFKKLHKSLQILHTKLYLKGPFPIFAKSRLFGRFDDRVIEERRRSSLELLEFVAQHPPLFTSQIFVKFFENGHRLNPKTHSTSDLESSHSTASEIQENPVTSENVDPSQRFTNCAMTDHSLCLGGIWNYRQDQEIISISSGSDVTSTTDGDSMLSLADSDLAQFDPLRETNSPTKSITQNANSNSWLLAALMECNQTEELNSPPLTPKMYPNEFLNLDQCSLDSTLSKNLNAEYRIDGDSRIKELESPPLTPLSPFSPEIKCDDNKYILAAADAISLAQQNEANGKFHEAFAYYKTSVEILLKGVQGDVNELRRDAVRKKTAQYLSRAESIYKTHLSQEIQDDNRWGASEVIKSISVNRDLLLGLLQSPVSDLKNYRVLGVIDKVLLVLDVTDNKTYVMKIIRKSACSDEWSVPSVVPSKLRFMVQLFKFIENDYAIFLVLEHAAGGKLWVYVKSYLQQSPSSPLHTRNNNTTNESRVEQFVIHANQTPTENSNVYSGRKLMNQEDREEEIIQFDQTDQDKKIDEADLDLIADEECPSSYARLFTTYAASLPSEKVVGLAKCHVTREDFLADDKEISPIEIEKDDVVKVEDVWMTQSQENCFVSSKEFEVNDNVEEVSGIVDLDNVNTIEDLGKLQAQDLITYAQRLIETVDQTIRESSDSVQKTTHLEKFATSKNEPVKILERQTRSISIGSFTNEKNRRSRTSSRHMSEDSLFTSPAHEARLSLSAGSLAEVGRPRRRHLSMVFQQLDVNNSRNACLPEACIRTWAAEMVVAISQLHGLGIICRDLCPDNILLGSRGHILLTYFCQWGCVERSIRQDAIDNMYAAPEVSTINPIIPACDWWSLGALLFELLTGKTLVASHPGGINSHTQLSIPTNISTEAQSLLKELLRYYPNERLGSTHNGLESLRAHSFFHGIDWDKIIHGEDT